MSASGAREVITGIEYVRQMTALESDRRARAAFQALALGIAPAGGRLLDFGAGTGIDARVYAENGLTVCAYDVDSKMCEFCQDYCRDQIEAGRVVVESSSYLEFLSRDLPAPGVNLVTSNFAPLNLVGDLRPLFAKFHRLTAAGGRVLASVINPTFVGDLKYGWWWRNALRLWRDGHYSVQGAQAPIVRRRLAVFANQCEPHFTLRHVFRGLPPSGMPDGLPLEVTGSAGGAGLRLGDSRFMFLLFDKR